MKHKQTAKVPTSRLSRLSSLGGLASRLAGNVLVEGAKKLSQGQKPSLNELVMTPKTSLKWRISLPSFVVQQ